MKRHPDSTSLQLRTELLSRLQLSQSTDHYSQSADHHFQSADHHSQLADHHPRSADHHSQTADHSSQSADWRQSVSLSHIHRQIQLLEARLEGETCVPSLRETEHASAMVDLHYLGDYENIEDIVMGCGADHPITPAGPEEGEQDEEEATVSFLPTLRVEERRQEVERAWQDDVEVVGIEEEQGVRLRGRKVKRLVSDWEWKLGAWEAGEGRLHSCRTRHGLILLGS